MIEDLQTRLNEQRVEETTANHAGQASHPAPTSDSEEGMGEKGADFHYSLSYSLAEPIPNFGDIQPWSPRMVESLPALPPAPLDTVGIPRPSLAFSISDLQPQTGQPSPPAEVHLTPMICTDLDQLFFDRAYPFVPIVQKFRYLSWSQQADKSKPKLCLQYAMRTLAASFSSQFQLIRNSLYKQARQLLDTLETDCQDNQAYAYSLSIEQVQAWILLAMYEWMSYAGNYQCGMVSAGRAFRLVQLMRLYDLDGHKNPDPTTQGRDQVHRDWVDVESMRRTFWLAFTIDRFTSAIDGLPLTFDERQIRTRLPAPDACFTSARPTTMGFLSATINAIENERQIDSTSPFTQSIIASTVCGRVLEHRHQYPVAHQLHLNGRHPPERVRDAMYEFCNRHRSINALLAQHQKLLSVNNLSEHPDPLLIFVALTEYMAVFMLYETIESKFLGTEVQAKQVADALSTEQKQQLGDAVNDLSTLTTTLRQLNHFQTHPLTPIPLLLIAKFCLAHNRLHEESYSTLIPHIHAALQGLTGLNALAQIAVQLLSN
ncbi:hypothetical protein O1611_g4004 [Lasiodiplodia mahajangana]|uniref:Uncharacterized protein n=1 Tax=Lasiodiplodia mahajangana TaxID=1108764 RepID=A0ACC2JQT8_9PEZI|nr:hypothetical protein O1611_g4004 [Lasiodiplodia mahajangana]